MFVVEDAAVVRERLIGLLSEIKGLKVVGYAADAATALEQIQTLKPALVLLDIRLYKSNGFEVLQGIQQLGLTASIMVLSNYSDPQYRKKFLENGANYFFDKSADFEQAFKELTRLARTRPT